MLPRKGSCAVIFVASFLSCLGVLQPSIAQPYPTRTIKIVATFAPGGASDILGRIIGQKLQESWGQPVIVENRAGAGGIVGTEYVAKSAADGYTLVVGYIGTHAVNPSLYSKLSYDAVNDFAPVAFLASIPSALVVHPSVPAKTLPELIALAKSRPGQLNYGSGGIGTAPHLAGELFKTMTGVDMVHVPYKGSGPAVTDLLSGQISLMFNTMIQTVPYVKEGNVRALAVTSATRSPTLPDLPTVAEAGVPGYEMVGWFGILAPAGTPKEIVGKLNTEIVKILNMADVKKRLSDLGAEPTNIVTPEQFGEYIKAEIAKWRTVVEHSGMRVE
jgi:tripartite-type tricarboxylate transporter receptor subunit TctC